MRVITHEAPVDRPIGFATVALGVACLLLVLKMAGVVSWSWRWVGIGAGVMALLVVGALVLGSFALPMKNGRYHPE
jgi:hypothetical protein